MGSRNPLYLVVSQASSRVQIFHLNAICFWEQKADFDEWMQPYNEQRARQWRWCFGKTLMQTFLDSKALARKKQNMAMAA